MAPSKQSPDLLFAAFNQDFSCVSVGTRKAFSIYNCDPYGKVYSSKDEGAIGIVEMLFCTSLVALVGAGDQPKESPRRLKISNTKRNSTICELLFPTSILGVKLNRKRMVVVLEEEIYIYDVSTMKLLHTIETSVNTNAVCALSPSSENSYLAYPSPIPSPTSPLANASQPPLVQTSAPGDVLLFDTLTLSASNVIQAHKTPIAFLSLNSTGTLLATCSDKGTVIRVFSVPRAEKVAEFRRGTYPARIFSINFNLMSTFLAVSSDSDTIHIFKLAKNSSNGSSLPSSSSLLSHPTHAASSSSTVSVPEGPSSPSSISSSQAQSYGYETLTASGKPSTSATASLRRRSLHLTRNLAGSMGGYLPSAVTGMWEPQRDFAHIKLRGGGTRCVVAMSGSAPQVFVISSTGLFQAYNFDYENGGECALMKEFSLTQENEYHGDGGDL